ncbi:SsgA family sporulation/cell division regulator [Amycolatopsis australiensis]|uniref:Streptomyces sporulation and cell division protein, SsgA n=1 Tax=Amycolatopsis australiensis TaxID=546364 RepID=A0A1K1PSH2_9PSEU|nr:SsgA family sporulation/cell division regulator [Amycolatopsis australiensis]SFW50413.1 Streptomyces sporulation and cell division protein, SsgA [Amycolatopsis australiensis]
MIWMELPALLSHGQAVVSVRYEATDPYAVTLRFPAEVCPEEWVIGRDLLADVLTAGRAGAVDVQMVARGDLIVLGLSTPDGAGWAVFRRDDVEALMTATHRMVRPGEESQFLDWSDTTDFPGVAP